MHTSVDGLRDRERRRPGAQLSAAVLPEATHLARQFCWHLRIGFYREVDLNRMKEYAEFFYKEFLLPHLLRQEKLVLGAVDLDPGLKKAAFTNHRRLKRLFQFTSGLSKTLGMIEEKIEEYLRFEKKIIPPQLRLSPGSCLYGKQREAYLRFSDPLAKKLSLWSDRYWDLD